MLDYKLVDAQFKDSDILVSIKLVTMIDDEMDKVLSYTEKNKIRKSVDINVERTCESYKIIYVGKKIAGAYLTLPYEEGIIIDEIYLFEEFRNNGIGTDIIKRIQKENSDLYVWVYKNNKKAIDLFERLGFRVISNGRTLIMKYDKVYINIKDKLDGIKLGYRDKEGNYYSGFKYNFKDIYYLQSPKQLLESKVGCCFDQVELERDLVSKLNVDCRTYYMMYSDDVVDYAHTFLIYKDSKKYYWLENAWLKYKGVHVYDSKEELFEDIVGKFVNTIPNGNINKIKLFMYDKPRFGLNYSKLLAHFINSKKC
ncbi:MAG: GNAT family N-acetyltransferase [Candidatus Coprovivens sp.]